MLASNPIVRNSRKDRRSAQNRKLRLSQGNATGRAGAMPRAVVPGLAKIQQNAPGAAGNYYRALVDPSSGQPTRLHSGLDTDPTSVMHLTNTVVVSSAIAASANYPAVLPAGNTFIAMFKQPTRAFVYPKFNVPFFTLSVSFVRPPVLLVGIGTATMTTVGETTGTAVYINNSAVAAAALVPTNYWLPIAYAEAIFGVSSHGGRLYPGEADGVRFIWVDAGDTILLNTTFAAYTGAATSATTRWSAYRVSGYDGALEEVFTTSGLTFVAPAGDYYALKIIDYTVVAALTNHMIAWDFTIQHTAGATSYSHNSMPEVDATPSAFLNLRTTAASMLLTSIDSPLKKEGQVFAARLSPSTPFQRVTVLDVQTPNSAVFYTGPAEHGAYGWMPLDEYGRDFHPYRKQATRADGTVDMGGCFSLRSKREYLIFWYLDSDPSTANSFMARTDYHTEFKSSSQLFTRSCSKMRDADIYYATEMARKLPGIMENPTHLAQIMGMLNKGASFTHKHRGKIGAALSALFPEYAAVFKSINSILG